MDIATAINLLLSLVARAGNVSDLIKNARAEGRESLTEDEVDALLEENNAARAELDAAIKAHGG